MVRFTLSLVTYLSLVTSQGSVCTHARCNGQFQTALFSVHTTESGNNLKLKAIVKFNWLLFSRHSNMCLKWALFITYYAAYMMNC